MTVNIEERRQRAVSYFKEGYNCSQSVFLAYADLFEVEESLAKKVSLSFGVGMGHLGEVCGAASGMFMTLGLLYPADPADKKGKSDNYAAVRRCAANFTDTFGELTCAKLLKTKHDTFPPSPSDPYAEYYKVRPCAFFVARAAEIVGAEILNTNIG